MCGIAGFWQPSGFNADEAEATARRMACTIRHRGPDDAGVWVDGTAGVALAYRRLSIVDLSAEGLRWPHLPGQPNPKDKWKAATGLRRLG